jgi:hypothetical protein
VDPGSGDAPEVGQAEFGAQPFLRLVSASIHRSGVDSWVATNVKRAL